MRQVISAPGIFHEGAGYVRILKNYRWRGSLERNNILCIGAGYVGGPTMAMIAYKCPQYKVTVVDINHEKIARWNSDDLPVYEPGLDEIIRATRGKNLFFETDIDKGIRESGIIFVGVNTPTKTFGAGAGKAADLQYWEKTARQIREASESPKIVVEKCTIPVKTALAMERILTSKDGNIRFDVLSNPEFLAEGTAIHDLEFPDRVLDRFPGDPERDRGPQGRRRYLSELGAARQDHRKQYMEQRAVKACRECLPGTEDILDKRNIGVM